MKPSALNMAFQRFCSHANFRNGFQQELQAVSKSKDVHHDKLLLQSYLHERLVQAKIIKEEFFGIKPPRTFDAKMLVVVSYCSLLVYYPDDETKKKIEEFGITGKLDYFTHYSELIKVLRDIENQGIKVIFTPVIEICEVAFRSLIVYESVKKFGRLRLMKNALRLSIQAKNPLHNNQHLPSPLKEKNQDFITDLRSSKDFQLAYLQDLQSKLVKGKISKRVYVALRRYILKPQHMQWNTYWRALAPLTELLTKNNFPTEEEFRIKDSSRSGIWVKHYNTEKARWVKKVWEKR